MAHALKLEKPKSLQVVKNKIPAFQPHRSQDELAAMGKAMRDKCPRTSLAEWKPPKDRPDPVRLRAWQFA
jgi:hypothetical protein